MEYRQLGSTGIQVSRLAFGAGPVSALMTGDNGQQQVAVLRRVLDSGINWIDTAATYGDGQSETNLGRVLHQLAATDAAHIATKVRFMPADLVDISGKVQSSMAESLTRLGVDCVSLLQLHNSITRNREDEPTSITPEDVLKPGGVADSMAQLQSAGMVQHIGLTLIGQPDALKEVIHSGRFAAAQVPYHVMNPSAGAEMKANFTETNFGNVIAACHEQKMGVLAIRVFAGGSLVGQPPSAHTYRTKFFPLDLYQRDSHKAAELQALPEAEMPTRELALRYVLSHPQITSAIIGFGEPTHVDQAVQAANKGHLSESLLDQLTEWNQSATQQN